MTTPFLDELRAIGAHPSQQARVLGMLKHAQLRAHDDVVLAAAESAGRSMEKLALGGAVAMIKGLVGGAAKKTLGKTMVVKAPKAVPRAASPARATGGAPAGPTTFASGRAMPKAIPTPKGIRSLTDADRAMLHKGEVPRWISDAQPHFGAPKPAGTAAPVTKSMIVGAKKPPPLPSDAGRAATVAAKPAAGTSSVATATTAPAPLRGGGGPFREPATPPPSSGTRIMDTQGVDQFFKQRGVSRAAPPRQMASARGVEPVKASPKVEVAPREERGLSRSTAGTIGGETAPSTTRSLLWPAMKYGLPAAGIYGGYKGLQFAGKELESARRPMPYNQGWGAVRYSAPGPARY